MQNCARFECNNNLAFWVGNGIKYVLPSIHTAQPLRYFPDVKVPTSAVTRIILYACKVCARVDICWNGPPKASFAHLFFYTSIFFFFVSFERCFLVFILSHTIIQRVSNVCNQIIPNNNFYNNYRYYTVQVLMNSTRDTQLLYSLGSDRPKLISSVETFLKFYSIIKFNMKKVRTLCKILAFLTEYKCWRCEEKTTFGMTFEYSVPILFIIILLDYNTMQKDPYILSMYLLILICYHT